MPTTPDDERGRACGALGPARGAPCRPCSPKTTCVTDFDCGALFAAGEAHDPSADDRVDRRMHFRRVFGEGVLEPSWAVCDDNPLPRNPSAPKGNIRGALGASFATSAEVLVTALRCDGEKARATLERSTAAATAKLPSLPELPSPQPPESPIFATANRTHVYHNHAPLDSSANVLVHSLCSGRDSLQRIGNVAKGQLASECKPASVSP